MLTYCVSIIEQEILVKGIMNIQKKNDDLPVVYDSASITKRKSWGNGEIIVAETGIHEKTNIPEYFRTSNYAILFITQGTLNGRFNMVDIELKAPAAVYIFNDHVLHYNSSTQDLKVRLISFSPVIADELSLSLPYDKMYLAYLRPVAQLDELSMRTCLHYLDLFEDLMQMDSPNRHTTLIQLIRSLVSFLFDFYTGSISLQKPISRSEELAGLFLSLVDMYCHEHHHIKWYADKLHYTPIYLSNVVKRVTGSTVGDHIANCLVRQAKSLLLTTVLSVQEIADRLGFQNQSHFGTFFRRSVGKSPRAFRRGK